MLIVHVPALMAVVGFIIKDNMIQRNSALKIPCSWKIIVFPSLLLKALCTWIEPVKIITSICEGTVLMSVLEYELLN